MEVADDAGTGGPSHVEAHIQSVRLIGLLQYPLAERGQIHHLTAFCCGCRSEGCQMAIENNHQVSITIEKDIEDNESVLAPVQYVGLGIISCGQSIAEEAPFSGLVSGEVFKPPGGEETFQGI